MKKKIVIATGLAVLSTGAFASKARMEALGQNGQWGSRFLEDSRNVFRNPSELNTMKNYVVTEWGANAGASATAGVTDETENTPRAEGGFFNTAGNFVYGAYLGNNVMHGDHFATSFATTSNTNTARGTGFYQHVNGLDLFLAGDAGVQWGARLHYTSGKDERGESGTEAYDVSQSALGLAFGMTMGDLQASLGLDLSDKSEGFSTAAANKADKWEADAGIDVEVSYKMNDNTFYAGYTKSGSEVTVLTAKTERSNTEMELGAARTWDLGSNAMLFADVHYYTIKSEVKATTTDEAGKTLMPLTIGFEAEATSWLTLRGSVSMNIMGGAYKKLAAADTDNDKKFKTPTENVAAGATLNLGKFKIDGMVGTDDAVANSNGETGQLRLDGLMSRVAVTYNF